MTTPYRPNREQRIPHGKPAPIKAPIKGKQGYDMARQYSKKAPKFLKEAKVIPIGYKCCTECGLEKPLSGFSQDKHTKSGFRSKCKDCRRERSNEVGRKWRFKNKEKSKEDNIWFERKSTYGITKEEYYSILASQGNKCPICSHQPDDLARGMVVDHNHDTGEIRGILCKPCNRGLGLFRDSPSSLLMASQYLEKRGFYGKAQRENGGPFGYR